MGHLVEQEMSRSKASSDAETTRFWQACFINWCDTKHVPDPCGSEEGYERIACYFIKSLILTNNCRADTARGYADAINTLFDLRNFELPIEFSNKMNMVAKTIANLKKEEDVAKQRSPLTAEIFVHLKKLADESFRDSESNAVFDWFCVIRILGFRCAQYAQKTQTKVEIHKYPSGKQVVKAFVRADWTFYDKKGRIIVIHGEAKFDSLGKCRVIFRIQKNRQNGQKLTFRADPKHPEICPARAAYRIYLRSICLGQSDNEPMGVFVNNKGVTKYLTGGKIADILQKAAKIAHPDWTADEISRITSHSGRVQALVLLSEAGKPPTFMKARLRWLGESFRLYLRDTAGINLQHNDALDKASVLVIELLGGNLDILPNVIPVDNEMGNFDEQD